MNACKRYDAVIFDLFGTLVDNVIVIGELRGDPEVIQLTVQAAETGHLVLTCIHANDAISPLGEMLDAGVKRWLLTNNLIGVVYQQLAAKDCTACMVKAEPEPALLDRIRQAAEDGGYPLPENATFYKSAGCDACRGGGHPGGRLALHEFLTFTPAVRSAFLHSATLEDFTKAARAQGQLSFFAAQAQKAVEGTIALDTLLRFLPY